MNATQTFPVGLVYIDPDNGVDAMVALVGRARGFALNIGTLAVICATAETEEERTQAATELRTYQEMFRKAMSEAIRNGAAVVDMKALRPERIVLQRFLDRIATMSERAMEFGRPEAIEVAVMARQEVLPTIYSVIAHIQARRDAALEERLAEMSNRGAMLDRVMTDMGRISRMIGIVSINASVEAARSGGSSGRTFQVIAIEIRKLAAQSSELLSDLRQQLVGSPTVVPARGTEDQRRRSTSSVAGST